MAKEKKRSTFDVNDEVVWWSSAGGGRTEKRGKVVKVVQAGVQPSMDKLAKKYGAKSVYGGGWPRSEESYVVLVSSGTKAKPTLYWPRTSVLQRDTQLDPQADFEPQLEE